MPEDVSLREYMECQYETLKKLMEERLRGMDKAQESYAAEMARRLEMLNHAQEYITTLQNTFTPRELYDRKHAEIEKELDSIRHIILPREVFDRTLEEWSKWRTDVNASIVRAAERKAVMAALLMSGLTLLGVITTTVLRVTGH
jgi:hypothetical protein